MKLRPRAGEARNPERGHVLWTEPQPSGCADSTARTCIRNAAPRYTKTDSALIQTPGASLGSIAHGIDPRFTQATGKEFNKHLNRLKRLAIAATAGGAMLLLLTGCAGDGGGLPATLSGSTGDLQAFLSDLARQVLAAALL